MKERVKNKAILIFKRSEIARSFGIHVLEKLITQGIYFIFI